MSALRLFGAIARAFQVFLTEDAGPTLPRWAVAAAVAPTDHMGAVAAAAAAAATATATAECLLARMAEAGAAPASVWISVGAVRAA